MEELDYNNGAQRNNDNDAGAFFLQQTIQKTAKDMKFVGIFSIIYGALICLTIIGAIIGIPTIIMGQRLNQSAEAFQNYIIAPNAITLREAMEKQGSYFFIQKVLIIIGLVFMVLYAFFIMSFIASARHHTIY